jgi:excisionase family DNA binding protein
MAKTHPQGECLVFTGKRNRKGYGLTSEQVDGATKDRWAHRVVFEHHNGPIPDGLIVRHSCDNPPCVEITHLHLGTVQDNANDMVERRRGRRAKAASTCPRGHDLTAPGAVFERPTRSKNRTKEASARCAECRRVYGRESRERQGYVYTGQPTNRDKTHCKNGHEFTEDNTHHLRRGGRKCRTCAREYARNRDAALRAQRPPKSGPALGEVAIRAWLAHRPDFQADALLQVGQVADAFEVSTRLVREWGKAGLLPAQRTPGGHRRFRVADVDAAVRGAGRRGTPLTGPC